MFGWLKMKGEQKHAKERIGASSLWQRSVLGVGRGSVGPRHRTGWLSLGNGPVPLEGMRCRGGWCKQGEHDVERGLADLLEYLFRCTCASPGTSRNPPNEPGLV